MGCNIMSMPPLLTKMMGYGLIDLGVDEDNEVNDVRINHKDSSITLMRSH